MKKLRRKNGFTLIEMLIVVAIIAILIAVSIPLVGSALDRAREATDAANERAFKAALTTAYLQTQAGMNAPGEITVEFGKVYCYDAVNGKICADATGFEPYGKAKRDGSAVVYDHTDKYLWGHVGSEFTRPGDGVKTVYSEVSIGWNGSKKDVEVKTVDGMTLTTTWWAFD